MSVRKRISLFASLALLALTANSQTLIDSVTIGKTTSETNHSLSGSSITGTNATNSKIYRESTTSGYFSYALKVDSVGQNELRCTYWGSDAGNRAFVIYVDGTKLSYQRLNTNSSGKLFTITYSLPFVLTRHKASVTIKFQAKTDSIAGGLYNIFSYKSAAAGSYGPAGVHDPSSIIKCGNKYWVFSTGDGIYAQYSTDLITWTAGPSPFAKWGFPSWISSYAYTSSTSFEGNFWAPDIIYMNGQYYLYYSCSIWGTMSSCIGVIVNKTLEPSDPAYKWVDQGYLGISYSSGVNAIDPAVTRGGNGKIWLTYGSFNLNGIMVTEVDSTTGKSIGTKTSIANSWTGGSNYGEGEGSCMIYHDGYYYLFYNKGGCCSGIASSYYIVMGRSTSPTGPFYDKSGKAMRVVGATSGGTIFFKHDNTRGLKDRYYGPGHLGYMKENGTEYLSFHYYDPNGYYPNAAANYMGGPTLGIGMLVWGTDGWPTISFDFLSEGKYKLKNKNSNLYWDLYNSNSSSTKVVQYGDAAVMSQQWSFEPLGTGEYKITNNAKTSVALEVAGASHTTSNGALMQVAAYTDSIYQKFRTFKSPTGEIIIYPSRASRVIEIPYASTASNVQLGLYDYNTCTCQRWLASPITDFTVSKDTLRFEFNDTTGKTFTFETATDWTLTSSDSWITLDKSSGFGVSEIKVNVDNYAADTIRLGEVIVSSSYIDPKKVIIKQLPASLASYINIDPDTLTLSATDTAAIAIAFSANTDWSISNNYKSWITLSDSSGIGSKNIQIKVGKNSSTSTRLAKLTVSSSVVANKTILVRQYGYGAANQTVSGQPQLKLYPNPVYNAFEAQCKVPATIQLLSASGNVIFSQNITESPVTIQLNGYPSGIYFVKVTNSEGTAIKKLIKN
jgi:arabinan endo-1,5-alpha-L-arabinosidase